MSIREASRCPYFDALCSGLQPQLSRESTSAPHSMSKCMTSTFPLNAAKCNGVCSIALRPLTSALRSSNDFTTSMTPSSAASCNEVFPFFFLFSSAPYSAAFNVVERSFFRIFASALYLAMNFATLALPFSDARCNGHEASLFNSVMINHRVATTDKTVTTRVKIVCNLAPVTTGSGNFRQSGNSLCLLIRRTSLGWTTIGTSFAPVSTSMGLI
jgi:hypothetical protein